MTRKILSILLCAVSCQVCASAIAQDNSARNRLSAAHAQYYTPTVNGLKSFRCEATIDWKAMLGRFAGTEIPDDSPILKYLQTVHLSVSDQLKGKGSLEWSSDGVPPAGKEQGANQMRDGLETTVAGFFQSWNAYMNGSMVPLPDSTVKITDTETGIHLSGTSTGTSFDEDYDKNMLLTQVLVVTPDLKVLAKPVYVSTPDGLVISTIASQVNQPPSAPQTQVTIRIDYAKVDSFQIPSHVVFDIKNTGVIEVGFSACQVSVADWAKKP